jgi:hypothetical protein
MGCWGFGNFENDDALDWLGDLRDGAGFGAVDHTLRGGCNGAYIAAREASKSLAAAEVVAALQGRPAGDLPVEVARWVAENRGQDASGYRETALNQVRAILSGHSELRERWESNEADFPFWKATLESLLARLETAGH